MLSSETIQLVFSSWDIVKNIPDHEEMISNLMSEKLSDSAVAEWFSGPSNFHYMDLVKMIDLIVHLLGPDLDVIIEELTSQGRRHHRHNSDMLSFLHKDIFAVITTAFIDIVRACIEEQAVKEAAIVDEESIMHPCRMASITQAWSEIFTMIRAIMKQGVKLEIKRQKIRAEKYRQEILMKQDRRSSSSTDPTSDTSSEAGSDLSMRAPVKKGFSRGRDSFPSRGVGRTVSAKPTSLTLTSGKSKVPMLKGYFPQVKKTSKIAAMSAGLRQSASTNSLRSRSSRSPSAGIELSNSISKAGLSMLLTGPSSRDKRKSSKQAASSISRRGRLSPRR